MKGIPIDSIKHPLKHPETIKICADCGSSSATRLKYPPYLNR